MPKETFYNLSKEKQTLVLDAVRKEFEAHPISQASVKHIVTDLGIARGSFYSYFENLEESYFTILDRETIETHDLFLKVFNQHEGELFLALKAFGEAIAQELFKTDRHALYKNRYLHWTADLDRHWKEYREDQTRGNRPGPKGALNRESELMTQETMQFVRALVHDLIRRLFTENWDAKTFLTHYNYHLYLMEYGVKAALEHKGEPHGNN